MVNQGEASLQIFAKSSLGKLIFAKKQLGETGPKIMIHDLAVGQNSEPQTRIHTN